MRVLVTAGGTREPIDDVRVLANRSTGRLGARLVEALAARGHAVTWVHGVHAARPELPEGADVRGVLFDTSHELGLALTREVPGQDAVFHAAAVADYLPESRAGKLSSDADELVLRLRRAPKLVDGLRPARPDELPPGRPSGFVFDTFVADTSRYLPWLVRRLAAGCRAPDPPLAQSNARRVPSGDAR